MRATYTCIITWYEKFYTWTSLWRQLLRVIREAVIAVLMTSALLFNQFALTGDEFSLLRRENSCKMSLITIFSYEVFNYDFTAYTLILHVSQLQAQWSVTN